VSALKNKECKLGPLFPNPGFGLGDTNLGFGFGFEHHHNVHKSTTRYGHLKLACKQQAAVVFQLYSNAAFVTEILNATFHYNVKHI
jgi:hypothetical protein